MHSAYHGPDTLVHFDNLSINGILNEFKLHAPELWKLLTTIAQTDMHSLDGEEEDLQDTAKVVVSLCTLLKRRSRRVLGLQLLMGFMLIARAINKRVGRLLH